MISGRKKKEETANEPEKLTCNLSRASNKEKENK